MTRLLLLILMFSVGTLSTGSLYSQDSQNYRLKYNQGDETDLKDEVSKKKTSKKKATKKKGYRPHSVAVSQRVGGIGEIRNRISATANGTNGSFIIADGSELAYFDGTTTVIEFFTQKRKGRSQYTPMLGLRFSFPFSSYSGLYGGFRWGFIFGGSQYLFDLRTEVGTGWSMLANGGLIIDVGEVKSLHYPVMLGGEVDFKVIYNLHKFVGFTFGLAVGYHVSFDGTKANTTSGGIPEATINNGFSWNLNFGVMF